MVGRTQISFQLEFGPSPSSLSEKSLRFLRFTYEWKQNSLGEEYQVLTKKQEIDIHCKDIDEVATKEACEALKNSLIYPVYKNP